MFKSLARTAVNTAFRSSAARPAMAKSLPRALPRAMPSFRFMSTNDSEAQRPTMAEVQLLPRHVSEYSSELLISAALHGDSDAIRERLTREVMRVDSLEWHDATNKIAEIETNKLVIISELLSPINLPEKPDIIDASSGRNNNTNSILSLQTIYLFDSNC